MKSLKSIEGEEKIARKDKFLIRHLSKGSTYNFSYRYNKSWEMKRKFSRNRAFGKYIDSVTLEIKEGEK